MCRVFGVSRSGYYDWVQHKPSDRKQSDERLKLEIKVAHIRTRETYGTRRLQTELADSGIIIGRDRLARLRKELELRCKQKRKYKATTNSNHSLPVAPNLLNQTFEPTGPNQVWVTDLTYVATQEGWLYLAGVKDVYTCEIVGYAMGERMTKELTGKALFMAVRNQRPPVRLIHHSDSNSLLRYLQSAGVDVLEVTAPDKMERRRRGKSDTIDAESAAHAAFSLIRTVTPKTRGGMIEALRVLKVCRKTAVAARRTALQMIQMNIVSAPDELRDQIRSLSRMQLIRTLASWRSDVTAYRNVQDAYRIALKSLARRYLELHDEIADLDVMLASIVDELAPELIKRNSVGYECASQLLITAGDNPQRLHSEAGFAALCGVSPVPASSGKKNRHRLNRGGDRAANSALHIIAIGRLRTDTKTQEYIGKRVAEGHSKMEALRCLKRYISREVYTLLRNQNRQFNSTQITT